MPSFFKCALCLAACSLFGLDFTSAESSNISTRTVTTMLDDDPPRDPFHPLPITDPNLCSICHGAGGGLLADEFVQFESIVEFGKQVR